MKNVILAIVVLSFTSSKSVCGQSFEQIAVNFYADEVLDLRKKAKIFYDGTVVQEPSKFQQKHYLKAYFFEHTFACYQRRKGERASKSGRFIDRY